MLGKCLVLKDSEQKAEQEGEGPALTSLWPASCSPFTSREQWITSGTLSYSSVMNQQPGGAMLYEGQGGALGSSYSSS